MHSNMSTILALLLVFLSVLNAQPDVSRTILVDKRGGGNFTTLKQAIDSIPSNNLLWTRIFLNHGVYVEKIVIPKDKPYIILQGDLKYPSVVEYGDSGNVVESPTFKLEADNFVARNIVFKNTYNRPNNGKKIIQAPAASLTGDKASFYHCKFISVQDTLHDGLGRHYFNDCFVEGAIDFIWGNGQSIYEKCKIISVTDRIGRAGFITAQGRNAANEPTGYVFNDCHVNGTGPIFLGRPYRNYSRVVFASTYMENIITPEGWSEWLTGPLNLTTFSEVNCKGPGADMSRRVSWEKKLSTEEVAYFNHSVFHRQRGMVGKATEIRPLYNPLSKLKQ